MGRGRKLNEDYAEVTIEEGLQVESELRSF